MNGIPFSGSPVTGQHPLSRRSTVLGLGGGLTALLVSGFMPAVAQEASPSAGAPAAGRAFLAIRQYQLTAGHTIEDLVATVSSGFLPILKQVPGFLEYTLAETSDGVVAVSVFVDEAGAEESTRRAADWVKENLAGFFAGPPAVTTGSIRLHETGEMMTGTPAPS